MEKLHIIFMARMVREKGAHIVVEAANILRKEFEGRIDFWLCGGLSNNPNGISEEELRSWCDGDYLQWLGHRSDVKELLQQSSIVVFPSYYHEGLPKSLIEATAIGRPIITTDSVGCRDTVEDGFNGFLIPIKNANALADKLRLLIDNRELRIEMGRNSRIIAERDFSIEDVVSKHLEIYHRLSPKK